MGLRKSIVSSKHTGQISSVLDAKANHGGCWFDTSAKGRTALGKHDLDGSRNQPLERNSTPQAHASSLWTTERIS